MAKPKFFDGTLQIDHYGRITTDNTVKRHDIMPEYTDGVYLLLDDWRFYDQKTKKYNKIKSQFTLAELGAGPPIDPQSGAVTSINNYVEVPNVPFADELKFVGYHTGRYSSMMEFVSNNTGRTYRVFMKDFDDFVPHMINGIVRGKFIFRKRGYKFGLVLLP